MLRKEIDLLIEGQEVVTRSTALAARSLLISATAVLAIEIYNLNMDSLAILGVDLPKILYEVTASAVLGYGIYNLLLRLSLDYASWSHWFLRSNAFSQTTDGDPKREIGKYIDNVLEDLRRRVSSEPVQNPIDENVTKSYFQVLEKCGRHFSELKWAGRYFLLIHHGLIPLTPAGIALWYIWGESLKQLAS